MKLKIIQTNLEVVMNKIKEEARKGEKTDIKSNVK